jgi:N-acetylneuraminic acid mutarotase
LVDRVAAVLLLAAALAVGWQGASALPEPRSEVAAAAYGDGFAVVGGFLPDGSSSTRVDLYSVRDDRWQRLPDLPAPVNHAAAASGGGRLYVAGGYTDGFGRKLRSAYVLERSAARWRALPPMPAVRAAAGAAVVGGKLYVVGGVGPAGLAKQMLALDLARGRWSLLPGPTPREHLAVAGSRTRLYAVGGRTAGFDTNVSTLEEYVPRLGWRRLPPLPGARGGTGATLAGGKIVSVGGEAPSGTIGSVYAYDLARGLWSRLPDLPTPRHGLGVVAVGGRVYAVGGGPVPGLSASGANEFLELR